MGSRNHCEIIHCSTVNKKIFDIAVEKDFLLDHPEYEGRTITHNQKITHMMKKTFGLLYHKVKSEHENNKK